MMENNNKESFKLLSIAGSGSDSESEVPEFVLTPKKKRLKRRVRTSQAATRTRDPQSNLWCGRRNISLLLAAIFLFCWLLTLSWLTVLLHGNIQQLDEMVQRVVAGSQAVPDDLQKIHSISRELQQNQTQLTVRVKTMSAQILNLTQQLLAVQSSLHAYSDQIQSNPEPSNILELKNNVALWGSQIKDLNNTVHSLNQQQTVLDTLTQTLKKNLTAMEASFLQLSNVTFRPASTEPNVVHSLDNLRQVIAQVSANISETNSTLSKRLQWVQDDRVKDRKAVEALQELGQNFTARIKTLEGECAKVDAQNTLNTTLLKLQEQVMIDSQRLTSVEKSILSVMVPASEPEHFAPAVTQSSVLEGKAAGSSGSSMVEEAPSESVGARNTTPGG